MCVQHTAWRVREAHARQRALDCVRTNEDAISLIIRHYANPQQTDNTVVCAIFRCLFLTGMCLDITPSGSLLCMWEGQPAPAQLVWTSVITSVVGPSSLFVVGM